METEGCNACTPAHIQLFRTSSSVMPIARWERVDNSDGHDPETQADTGQILRRGQGAAAAAHMRRGPLLIFSIPVSHHTH